MRKILAALLILFVLFAFSACAKCGENNVSEGDVVTETELKPNGYWHELVEVDPDYFDGRTDPRTVAGEIDESQVEDWFIWFRSDASYCTDEQLTIMAQTAATFGIQEVTEYRADWGKDFKDVTISIYDETINIRWYIYVNQWGEISCIRRERMGEFNDILFLYVQEPPPLSQSDANQ